MIGRRAVFRNVFGRHKTACSMADRRVGGGFRANYIYEESRVIKIIRTSSLPGKLEFFFFFHYYFLLALSELAHNPRGPRYRLKDGGRHGGFTLKTTLVCVKG